MTRPTTIRIPKEILKEIDDRCENTGCTRNDFIVNSLEFILTGRSEFDFGEEESETVDQVKKDEPIPNKPLDNHEGKKPCLHFHWEGDKLVQNVTTWEEKSKT